MSCQQCESDKIFEFSAHHSDRFSCSFKGQTVVEADYAPDVDGICSGDGTGLSLCLECGQVQGRFPKEGPEIPEDDEDF